MADLSFRMLGVDVSASRALEQVGASAGKLQEGLGSALDGLKAIGPELAAMAGLGSVGATLGAGFMANLDLDEAVGKLQSQLGVTQKVAASYGAAAGEVYADNWGESTTSIMDDFAVMGQQLKGIVPLTDDTMKGIAEGAYTVSSAFDQEFPDVIRGVKSLLVNDLAPNADAAMDIITRGMQGGVNKADDFFDTLNEYGPFFKGWGLSGSEAVGMISAAVKAGARDSDVAADSLKEFSLRATDGSEATVSAYKALGLNAKQMSQDIAGGGEGARKAFGTVVDAVSGVQDKVKQKNILVSLFGTQAEDLTIPVLTAMTKATGGLKHLEGATDRAGAAMGDNFKAKLETFKRGIETNVTKAMAPAAQGAEDFFDGITQGSSGLGKNAGAFQVVGAGVRSLFTSLASGKSSGDGVIGVFSRVGATIHNTVLPVVTNLATAALPLLEDAWVALQAGVALLLPVLRTAASFLTGTVLPAIVALSGFIKEHRVAISSLVVMVGSAIAMYKAYRLAMVVAAAAQNAYVVGTNLVRGAVLSARIAVAIFNATLSSNPIGVVVVALLALGAGLVFAYRHSETFRNVVHAALDVVMKAVGPLVDAAKNLWRSLSGAFDGAGAKASVFGSKVGAVLRVVIAVVGKVVSAYVRFYVAVAKVFVQVIGILAGFVAKYIGFVGRVITLVARLVKAYVSFYVSVAKVIGQVIGVIAGFVGRLVGFAASIVSTVVGRWVGAFRSFVGALSGVISSAVSTVGRFITTLAGLPGRAAKALSGLVGTVTGAFSGAATWLSDAAGKVIDGFISGLTSKFDDVRSTLGNLTDMLPDWKGPAKKDATILHKPGQLVIDGFRKGMESRFPAVRKTLQQFTASLSSTDMASAAWRATASDTEKALRELNNANTRATTTKKTGASTSSAASKADKQADALRKKADAAAKKAEAAEKKKAGNAKALEKAAKAADAAADKAEKKAAAAKSKAKSAKSAAADAAKEAAAAKAAYADAVYAAQQAAADAAYEAAEASASSFIDKVKSDLDALAEKASNLRQGFASSVTDGMGLKDLFGDDGTGTLDGVLAKMQLRYDQTIEFQKKLAALQRAGLSGDLIAEVAAAGATAGSMMADQMLANGTAGIAELNSLSGKLTAVAEHGADQLTTSLYGQGASALGGMVSGLRSQFPELSSALDEVAAMVNGILSVNVVGGAVASAAAVATAAPVAKVQSAAAAKAVSTVKTTAKATAKPAPKQTVHINVKGAVVADHKQLGATVSKALKAHEGASGGRKR